MSGVLFRGRGQKSDTERERPVERGGDCLMAAFEVLNNAGVGLDATGKASERLHRAGPQNQHRFECLLPSG